MSATTWILITLVVVDSLILGGCWLLLRTLAPLPPRALTGVAAGLAPFVVHAVLFFRGAILTIHLVTLAAIFGLCCYSIAKWQSEESTT
jgi:hypothetical protein